MITYRDIEILMFLDAQGIATARQISGLYFPSLKAGRNRVHNLTKSGVIKKLSYKSLFSLTEIKADECLSLSHRDYFYTVGNKLETYRGSCIFWEMINHNLICNDVFLRIKSIIGERYKSVSFEKFDKKRKSDLAPDVTIIGNTFKLGIEFERTLKRDNLKYLSKFCHYSDSNYTHVLYVCKNNEIFSQIKKLSGQFEFIGSTLLTFENEVFSHNLKLNEFLDKKLNL